jgi:hypothetical protein
MSNETSTQALTVVNGTDGLMHVHKAGCQHLGRARSRSNGDFTLTAATRQDVINDVWSDFIDQDWDGDDSIGWDTTEFAPCVHIK